MKSDASLPDFLRPLFWDTDFDQLRVEGHERYVIERVLEYGDVPEVRWMMRTFDNETIADVVRESENLSRMTADFWAFFLDIPRAEVCSLSRTGGWIHRMSITGSLFEVGRDA